MKDCVPLRFRTPCRKNGKPEDSPFLFSCDIGVVKQCRGSAFVSMGPQTKVVCSVQGPHASTHAPGALFTETCSVQCDFRMIPSVHEKIDSQSIGRDRCMASIVQQAIESSILLDDYPKSSIMLNFFLLESDPQNDLAALIVAASLALADAAIKLRDLVSSYSVASLNGSMMIAEMTNLEKITHFGSEGRFSDEDFDLLQKKCSIGCKLVRERMDKCIRRI